MAMNDNLFYDNQVNRCGDEDIFRDLAPSVRAQIERTMTIAQYPAGHIFYSPDESDDRLLVLREGRVRLYKLSPEGRALTLYVIEPGAIFGELSIFEQWQHDSFAEAMTDCVVAVLGRAQMRRLMTEHPGVALRLMDVMSARLRSLERKLADIAFHSVPQRLATILLNLADCRPAPPGDAPPAVVRYTHQQLAEMIGSYRETVTKVIGEFREARLIRVEEDVIFLTDVARLEDLAGR